MSRRLPLLIALLAIILTIAVACSESDGDNDAPASPDGGLAFAVITHAAPDDAFWDVVKNGSEAAGEELGVEVRYQGHPDADAQARLIDAAVGDGVDGMAVSMANPDALEEAIRAAVAAGVPVVTINSGVDRFEEFGALNHVGQTELVAGEGAGKQFRSAGATSLICVVQEVGNIGLEERCQGASNTAGGPVEVVQVGSEPAQISTAIAEKLTADESIEGILVAQARLALPAVEGVKEAGSDALVGTFDISPEIIEAIEGDDILFAIDQQQYLQGYLPIQILKLFRENANTVGGGLPVLTGPGFVTKENASAVKELAAQGTR